MTEPVITIDGKELSEAQSKVIRLALFAFNLELSNPKVANAIGNRAIEYHLHLREVMSIIDGEGG